MKKLIIISLVFAFSLSLAAQSKKELRGIELMEKYEYQNAIKIFDELVQKNKCIECPIYLAESYFKTNQYHLAQQWYEQAFHNTLLEVDSKHSVNYLNSLIMNGHYDLAEDFIKKRNLENFQYDIDSIKSINVLKPSYKVTNLNINTENSEFASSFYLNKLFYSYERENKKITTTDYGWTGRPFLDIMVGDYKSTASIVNQQQIQGDINTIYHDASPFIDKNTNTLYFTRNNFFNKKTKLSESGDINLKIYTSKFKDNKWSDVEVFQYDSDEYSCGHPYISADGNTLFFTSDMQGGFGGTDIYYCKKSGNNWSAPINIGTGLNTEEDEMFPTVDEQGNLYFASKGHFSYGGFDVVKAKLIEDYVWEKPVNVGLGINSAKDDFGYITIDDTGNSGYFNSNRDGGKGADDIYYFEKIEEPVEEPIEEVAAVVAAPIIKKVKPEIRFTIVDEETGAPLGNVEVIISDPETGNSFKKMTDQNGHISFYGDPKKDYDIDITKQGYFRYADENVNPNKNNRFGLYKKVINKAIKIKNIYYDLNSAAIKPLAALELNKVVNLLSDNPAVEIELMSHTDSRASNYFNQKLSERRAQSAVSYILKHGISPSRIKAKGYGESLLVNHCVDGAKCSEEEHLQNRRTEFKVLNDGSYTTATNYSTNTNINPNNFNQTPVKSTYSNVSNMSNDYYATNSKKNDSFYYTVQIGAFSKKTKNFDHLMHLGQIKIFPRNKLFVYTIGEFENEENASVLKQQINEENPEAFVVKVKRN